MLIFFTSFILMLLCGSIFILGFFTITRGKIVINPDGSEEKEMEIFGGWQLFWEHVEVYRKIFYSGKQLEDKLKILEQLKPAYMGEISLTEKKKSLIFNTMPTEAEIRDIEFSLNTNVFKNNEVIFLYDEFPIYRFSDWVRKITNCYVCLSGWMGTICYFVINIFNPNLFDWASRPLIAEICFWAVYCISLAFLNKIIKENFDAEKK